MKFILILIFILLFNFSNGQNCESVKTGVFKLKIKDSEFTIKRTKKKETIYSKYGTVKYKIKWLSECEYILFKRYPKKTEKTHVDIILRNSNRKTSDTIYNKIIEVNEKEFRIESTDYENSDIKFEYVYVKKQ